MAEAQRKTKGKSEKAETKKGQNQETVQELTHEGQVAAVPHLQSTVGNRAVQRVLAEGSPKVIQRHVDSATAAMGDQAQNNLMSKWANAYLTSANQQSQIDSMIEDISTMSIYTALAEMHPCDEGAGGGDEPQVPAVGGV